YNSSLFFFFFFQAEDGIRDRNVTGVQTCALPIYKLNFDLLYIKNYSLAFDFKLLFQTIKILFDKVSAKGVDEEEAMIPPSWQDRSEERRVGKECRTRWWKCHSRE